jgi:hypothetical protein
MTSFGFGQELVAHAGGRGHPHHGWPPHPRLHRGRAG